MKILWTGFASDTLAEIYKYFKKSQVKMLLEKSSLTFLHPQNN